MAAPTLSLPKAMKRAIAAYERGSFDDAEKLCRAIVDAKADYFDALHLGALAQARRGHLAEAVGNFDRALVVRPGNAEVLSNRGAALKQLGRYQEAVVSFDQALAVDPNNVGAHSNRGNALAEIKRFDEALASYDRAIAIDPKNAEALSNRGVALQKLDRYEEALASFNRVLADKPNHARSLNGAMDCAAKLCDWSERTRFVSELRAQIVQDTFIVTPFVLFHFVDDPALQFECARKYIKSTIPSWPRLFQTDVRGRHDRLRVAYLSADFRQHATAYLMAGLFEKHNRSQFEIIGISFGADDDSPTRKRLVKAFDHFHDVRGNSDEEAANLIRSLEIDIAVDLKGYTREARPAILCQRPAPIQVNYLGYPGTMGAEFIDYIIADKFVAPFEHQPFFTERIVHLPDCYQVNDRGRPIAERTPARADMGLPARGFVFCCFNSSWKIVPDLFEIWMRLLQWVDGSVLWLYENKETTKRNLRNEALARGIDPNRVVFANRLPLEQHLARYPLADLFLDTLPCNAHTTASDALWAGVPVLTCQGEAFAGRVATSLLHAVGLREFVTTNLASYERLALKLGTEPDMLSQARRKLQDNRLNIPLFDTDRFRQHIEAAYQTMWDTRQRGEAPRSFSVAPI